MSPDDLTIQEDKKAKTGMGGVIGGSVRGLLIGAMKKGFWKAKLRKQAFINIRESTEVKKSTDKNLANTRTPPRHSKFAVKSQGILLSIVVFETYEFVSRYSLDLMKQRKQQHGQRPSSRSLVLSHMGAGAAAGVAQSVFWAFCQTFIYKSNIIREKPNFLIRVTAHHAVGYASLFGSYQGLRSIFLTIEDTVIAQQIDAHTEKRVAKDSVTLISTLLSGGLAGQIHYVVNHYTSHWQRNRTETPMPPRLRHTLPRVWPMAVAFAAFEYGTEIIDFAFYYYNEVSKSSSLAS